MLTVVLILWALFASLTVYLWAQMRRRAREAEQALDAARRAYGFHVAPPIRNYWQ